MKKFLAFAFSILLVAACQPVTYNTFGTISGTVLDAATGTPIQNATITLNPTGKKAFTGSDGFFEFDDLDPDQYKVWAQKDGYDSNSVSVRINAGETETITIPLSKKK